jgi:hypothetical protein
MCLCANVLVRRTARQIHRCAIASLTHLGLVLAEVLLGPAVHAGDAGLSVEVDHGCASAPRLRDLVDLAGGVTLLVAVKTVPA